MARPSTLRAVLPELLHVAGRFRGRLRDHRRMLALAGAALAAQVLLRLLEPWPLKLVFDRLAGTARPASDPGAVASLPPDVLLAACALAVLALVALRALATYASSVGFAWVGNQVLTRVREDLYRHLQGLSLRFHARARAGDLVVRVVNDVAILREVVVTAALPLAVHVLILAGMLGVMGVLDPGLTLVALAPLPLLGLTASRQSRRIQEVGRKQRARESALAATAAETAARIDAVQALSLEDHRTRSFTAASQRDLREGVQGKRLAAGLIRNVDLLVGISTALTLGLGGARVLAGVLTPGDLLVFLTYQRRAFRPARDFARYTARLAKATSAGRRVLDLLDERPEVVDRSDAEPAPRFRGAVSFRNVDFGYDSAGPVLRGLDLEVAPGERVAIVGASGAGKSTLIALLLRLFDPASGCVRVDGRDVREFAVRSLRERFAVVQQGAPVFAGTLRENLLLGAGGDASEEALLDALRVAHLTEFAERLPEGLDTPIGEAGATLSCGERQRVAIARAALRDAPVLLLDEPLTGLDPRSRAGVQEALAEIARGRTCLLVTHDPDEAARCDRVALLHEGRIAECGPHPDLVRRGGPYAQLVAARPSGTRETHRPEESRALAS